LVAAVSDLKTHASLQTRVGIATGLVVVGDLIGAGEAQERGIVGSTFEIGTAEMAVILTHFAIRGLNRLWPAHRVLRYIAKGASPVASEARRAKRVWPLHFTRNPQKKEEIISWRLQSGFLS
jgi:hypothetical protein